MKTFPILLAVTLIATTPTFSGNFTNLDFESAAVQITDPNFGWLDWNLAVPGWNHGSGSGSEIVYYGQPHLGMSPWYLLIDTNEFNYALYSPLAGNYSLAFRSGIGSSHPKELSYSAFISQTGDILPGTRSIHLLATGPFSVSLDGVYIPMLALGRNNYAGDVTDFAATTATLTIRNEGPPNPFELPTPVLVDEIVFSPRPIPEPSSLAIFAAALGSLALRYACPRLHRKPASAQATKL